MSLLGLLLAAGAWADVVYLKNGNRMEGIVQSETAEEVVLDMGFGTTSLPRSSVARIKRSASKDRETLRRAHQKEFFDSGRWVPKGCADLFSRYQDVGRAREKAMEARRRRESMREEEARLSGELGGLEGRERYDAWRRLQEIQTLLPLAERDMQAYFTQYKGLEEAVAAAPAPADGEERDFREQLGDSLKRLVKDFDQDSIVSRRSGSHLIVQALLDRRVPATLMVDTGASLTTISPAIAAKLAPVPGSESEGLSSMADGRRVKVKIFRVGSVEVGRSKEELVPVAVLPPPGPGVDGLLGMSFLEHFAVQVDGATGQLLLNRLK